MPSIFKALSNKKIFNIRATNATYNNVGGVHFTWFGPWPDKEDLLTGPMQLSKQDTLKQLPIIFWVERKNQDKALEYAGDEHITIKVIEDSIHYQDLEVALILDLLGQYKAFSLQKDFWSFVILACSKEPGCHFHLDTTIIPGSQSVALFLSESNNSSSKLPLIMESFFFFSPFALTAPYHKKINNDPIYRHRRRPNILLQQFPEIWFRHIQYRSHRLYDVFAMKRAPSAFSYALFMTSGFMPPNMEFTAILQSMITKIQLDFGYNKETQSFSRVNETLGHYTMNSPNIRDQYIGDTVVSCLENGFPDNVPAFLVLGYPAGIEISDIDILKKFHNSWRDNNTLPPKKIVTYYSNRIKILSFLGILMSGTKVLHMPKLHGLLTKITPPIAAATGLTALSTPLVVACLYCSDTLAPRTNRGKPFFDRFPFVASWLLIYGLVPIATCLGWLKPLPIAWKNIKVIYAGVAGLVAATALERISDQVCDIRYQPPGDLLATPIKPLNSAQLPISPAEIGAHLDKNGCGIVVNRRDTHKPR